MFSLQMYHVREFVLAPNSCDNHSAATKCLSLTVTLQSMDLLQLASLSVEVSMQRVTGYMTCTVCTYLGHLY